MAANWLTPNIPRLEIVKVPPVISSGLSFPSFACFGRQLTPVSDNWLSKMDISHMGGNLQRRRPSSCVLAQCALLRMHSVVTGVRWGNSKDQASSRDFIEKAPQFIPSGAVFVVLRLMKPGQ